MAVIADHGGVGREKIDRLSSNPKVMAAALVSGPYTKIYIRIVPITVDLDFLGFCYLR